MQMIHTVSSPTLTLTLTLTSGSSFTKIHVITHITMTLFKQCGCWVGTRGGGGGRSVAAHSIPNFGAPLNFLLQHHCGTALPRGGGGREDGGGGGWS